VDFHATILDGSYHPVDSSEMAFKIAGSMALKEAVRKAGLRLMEPIISVEVSTPESYMGDVIGDLSGRRGCIAEVDSKGDFAKIVAKVPLEALFGYTTALRSLTSGRANYSMEPSHFAPVPEHIEKDLLEKKK